MQLDKGFDPLSSVSEMLGNLNIFYYLMKLCISTDKSRSHKRVCCSSVLILLNSCSHGRSVLLRGFSPFPVVCACIYLF